MGSKFDRLGDLFSAIAFAEEGEHETAYEIMRPRKSLLVAVSDTGFDARVFRYALSLAKRISVDVEALYLTITSARINELTAFKAEAEKDGTGFKIAVKQGCMKKAILEHTEKRRDITLVVVGTDADLDIECKASEKSLSSAWARLKCPLVVVSQQDRGLDPAAV